jgi:hypothetical protein
LLRDRLRRLARRIPLYRDVLEIRDQIRVLRTMEALRYRDFEMERSERYRDPLRLHRHEHSVNSQNGEDGIIGEIFRRIGETNRVFLEIGVGNGNQNNTAFLLSQGWTGYWIDGDPSFEATVAARPDLSAGLKGKVGFVTRENIGAMVRELGVPSELDLLSLDVDQNTYYILEGLDALRPRVMIVEYNSLVPAAVDWKVSYDARRMWDGSPNAGASLKALERLGASRGYCLVGCDFNGVNAFFVRDDHVGDRFLAPYTAENHYEPSRLVYTPHRMFGQTILERA